MNSEHVSWIVGYHRLKRELNRPGKYLSLDCEMVGVGIDGKESSLARVSLVNYYGAIQMDEFVRQRERVVDYRTEFSGVRPSDMVNGTIGFFLGCSRVFTHSAPTESQPNPSAKSSKR